MEDLDFESGQIVVDLGVETKLKTRRLPSC